jgi:hypothetical protein
MNKYLGGSEVAFEIPGLGAFPGPPIRPPTPESQKSPGTGLAVPRQLILEGRIIPSNDNKNEAW